MAKRARFGTVDRLPSGRYRARYHDKAGRRHNAPNTFATKTDAWRWLATIETDMLRGAWVDPEAGRVLLVDYSAEWLDARANLRPRTVEMYEGILAQSINPTLGAVRLSELTTGEVREWYADLVRNRKPTVAPKAYRLLRTILATAVEDDLITKNPCGIKGAGVEHSPERPIATPEEVWKLADAIDPRFRAFVLSAAFLGLRYGELAGLAREHVNLLHRTVTIERQLIERKSGKTEFGPPKTEKGRRTIAIPAPLVSELEHHLANFAAPGRDGLVFVGERGARLTRGNWHPKWKEARAAAGLKPSFRFHDLRHTSNTLAAATGASTRELMYRMGHASPAAALRYQHATAKRDAEIADALGQLLDIAQSADRRDETA